MSKTMLFNPYSGKPRHPEDIASDPEGVMMLDPDMPVLAASAVQAAEQQAGVPAKKDSRTARLKRLRAIRLDSLPYRRGQRAYKTGTGNPYNGPELRDEWEAGREYARLMEETQNEFVEVTEASAPGEGWPEKMPSAAPVVQAAEQQAGACPIGMDAKGASAFCSAGTCGACRAQQAGAGLGDDMAECDLQFVESVVSGIATRQYGLASNSEGAAPVSDIRTASKLAQAALPRLQRAIAALYTADALRAKVEPSDAESAFTAAFYANEGSFSESIRAGVLAVLALQGAKLTDQKENGK